LWAKIAGRRFRSSLLKDRALLVYYSGLADSHSPNLQLTASFAVDGQTCFCVLYPRQSCSEHSLPFQTAVCSPLWTSLRGSFLEVVLLLICLWKVACLWRHSKLAYSKTIHRGRHHPRQLSSNLALGFAFPCAFDAC
jgi:hypothetical protein